MLAKALVTPQRLPNPALVGKSALRHRREARHHGPAGHARADRASCKGVGRDYPLSIEKLCPVLSYYVVKDWREGCERCKQILRYGGMGHTMSIHSRNEAVILEFGLHKPAYRICVNTPTTHGSIGLTTGLDPAMTLGCGGFGGNITSDNISPRHLLNIKRLAYEAPRRRPPNAAAPALGAQGRSGCRAGESRRAALGTRIDQYLRTRGFGRAGPDRPRRGSPAGAQRPARPTPAVEKPVAIVCEDDVRQAIRAGQTLTISDKTIVTPAARDLGEAPGVFRHAGDDWTDRLAPSASC